MKAGDKIKGSRFFRAFCCVCGDPIRVTVPTGWDHMCKSCEFGIEQDRFKHTTPRQVAKLNILDQE